MSNSDDSMKPAAAQRGRSPSGSDALARLAPRKRTTGAEAQARSKLVKRMRLILPGAACVLIAAFVVIVNNRSSGVDDAFLKDFETIADATEDLRMNNPRFAGLDDSGKPFEIVAETALQDPNAKNFVQLQRPRAVQGDDEKTYIVTAQTGLYQTETNILDLTEDVTLEHEFGDRTYVLRSPSARVSIKDQVVTSDAGVEAEGSDGGALRADRMTAFRENGRMRFEGNVFMRIAPDVVEDRGGALELRDREIDAEAQDEGL